MFEIDVVNKKGMELVESKLLHKKLEVRSYHSDWIKRRIDNYDFKEGIDYYIDQYSKMSNGKKTGGKLKKDFLITMDMAKELAMLENNDIGKEARKYFIAVEKEYQKKILRRAIGKETRKTLTDAIEESGENERMHGKGYSNFTRLVYSLTGLTEHQKLFKSKYPKDNYRDHVSPEMLKRIELAESLIKPLLELDKEYGEIKTIIEPLFKVKVKVIIK